VTDETFRGQYMLVFFGFTHCPDVCPTTLLLMQNALKRLGTKADKITPIFITVDPERDTPQHVGEYVRRFGERIVGLSGSAADIKRVADAYKVFYSKVPMSDPSMGYMVDHSGFLFLMGPDGKYLAHYSSEISEQALADALQSSVK
jgi:protein SCO1/2